MLMLQGYEKGCWIIGNPIVPVSSILSRSTWSNDIVHEAGDITWEWSMFEQWWYYMRVINVSIVRVKKFPLNRKIKKYSVDDGLVSCGWMMHATRLFFANDSQLKTKRLYVLVFLMERIWAWLLGGGEFEVGIKHVDFLVDFIFHQLDFGFRATPHRVALWQLKDSIECRVSRPKFWETERW